LDVEEVLKFPLQRPLALLEVAPDCIRLVDLAVGATGHV
jgi:hypothetical protein